jgi:ferritin-like metal-binding protein YciE
MWTSRVTPKAKEVVVQGLRNQHAVAMQAIATIERQLGQYDNYADLHARMQQDLTSSKTQAARLENFLGSVRDNRSI